MKIEDIDRIIQIEKCCFAITWTENMFLEELENSLAYYTVIKYFGLTVGYAGMWFVCDEAHMTNIAIDPEFRRKGLGRNLLSKIIDMAKNNGMIKMTLEVRQSNLAAKQLYTQFHFVECGIRKNYYEDNHEDALIMWRDL